MVWAAMSNHGAILYFVEKNKKSDSIVKIFCRLPKEKVEINNFEYKFSNTHLNNYR